MSGLFGGDNDQAAQLQIPTPKPVAPMPDPTSPLVIEARRRRTAEILQRGGRESTIMSDDKGTSFGRPLPTTAPIGTPTPATTMAGTNDARLLAMGYTQAQIDLARAQRAGSTVRLPEIPQ